MTPWLERWAALTAGPWWAVPLSVIAYLIAMRLYQRSGRASWANPVLWAVAMLVIVLLSIGEPYARSFAGAQPIHWVLGPAVVSMARPLWQRLAELRPHAVAILVSAALGGLAAALSAVLIGWALGLPPELLRSLAPKSVTAGAAISISEQLGGIANLTTLFTLITGLIGALSAQRLFDAMGIASMATRGLAMGTAAHGLGSARALQIDPDCGAYAVLALVLQVALASLLLPWVIPPLLRWLAG
jgi:putative effector of murein hydrolase